LDEPRFAAVRWPNFTRVVVIGQGVEMIRRGVDPGNRDHYRELFDRNGFIESVRFLAYLNDTKQVEEFAQ
jgi:hypothetical protein